VQCLCHRTPFATPEYVLCAADRFPRMLYVSTHRLQPRRNLNRSIWCRIELSVAFFGAQLFGAEWSRIELVPIFSREIWETSQRKSEGIIQFEFPLCVCVVEVG